MKKTDYTKTPSRIVIRGIDIAKDSAKIQATLERLYPGTTVNVTVAKK